MVTRAAVLIGIERIAGMTPLPGAVRGAVDMAAWATNQGWESVKVFSDADGQSVDDRTVSEHIDSLLQRHSLQQLLVYFAGHGQSWAIDLDFWLLSGTRKPGSVINVASTVALARQSGVPHITIIADACRNVGTANDSAISQIAVPLFPGIVNPASRSKVDQFYATKPTQASIEIRRIVDEEGTTAEDATNQINEAARQSFGIFTKCLLAALNGQEGDAKSRLMDDRIVVQPLRLATFLENQVPRESGRLAGIAQRPDCRPESEQVLSLVQAAAKYQMQVEVRLQDGSPAEGSTLELLRYDQTIPDVLIPLRRIRSWSLSEYLPRANFYGVRATLPDHLQSPVSPNPLTLLMDNAKVVVKMERIVVPEVRTRGDLEPSILDPHASLTSLRIDKTYVVGANGQHLSEAPTDGVFPVVEIDGLTGAEFRTTRFLRQGDRPEQQHHSDPETLRVIRQVTELAFREFYSAEFGMTILGIDEVEVFDTHSGTYAFHENGQFHVRGIDNTSSSLVLNLGHDRFAALARFDGFVGNVRANAFGVENLSYLPPLVEEVDVEMMKRNRNRKRVRLALAIAEEAARHGQFDLVIDESRPIAKMLRLNHPFHPILGILAAYAYHRTGALDQIRLMIQSFVATACTVPYDMYLLSGLRRDEIPCEIVPGYPMLTQGWLYLGSDLHPAIVAARKSLAPTLWSTVVGEAGRKLAEAVKRGEVK